MERLTEYSLFNKALPKDCSVDNDMIYSRLAAYELALSVDDTHCMLPEEVKAMREELTRWRSVKWNDKIQNPCAAQSGLICQNCDHKDEYIEQLEQENAALKSENDRLALCKHNCKIECLLKERQN